MFVIDSLCLFFSNFHFILIGLFILNIATVIHEFGHYITAIKLGVGVRMFSVGFGPLLWSYTDKTNVKWQIRLFPLGGCMQPKSVEDKIEADNVEGSTFEEVAWWKGVLIAFAGPFFNVISGFLMLILFYICVGIPHNTNEISMIIPDSVAMKLGLQVGDIVKQIDEEKVIAYYPIDEVIIKKRRHYYPKKLEINRQGENKTIMIKEKIYCLDIADITYKKVYTPIGICDGFKRVFTIIGVQFCRIKSDLVELLKNKNNNMSSVIGTTQRLVYIQKTSLLMFFFMFIMFSIGIGLMNLLPLMNLDGGWILLFFLHGLFGIKITGTIKKIIDYLCIFMIATFFIISLWSDLLRLIL
jgi:regulator of sigma E protease